MSAHIAFITAVFTLIYILRRLLVSRKQPGPYPPGPKGLPIFGNAFDFPTVENGQEYVKWQKRYGSDVLHASAFGTHVVIINSREVADALFERRALKYSDRPFWPIAELIGIKYNLAFIPYGPIWRLCRRISQQAFREAAMDNFNPVITQKVHQTLRELLHRPENFEDHNRMLSISIPMSAMYGYDVQSFEDPCVAAADESIILSVELLAPGGSMINLLPFLRFVPPWFPGATSRRKAERNRRLTDAMCKIPLDFVKSQMAKGIATPSFVSDFLEKKATIGASAEEEEAVLIIAPTVYAGASDTTISSTGTFFYLMAVNPDIQRKAQAEIDCVVGSKRLPIFEDRPLMPYIEAIYREVLRWRPPVQLGIPHCVTEDDFYGGYFIPKGTTVIGNIWAMTHDEAVYPEPMTFKPERFINPDGSLNDDDRILAFGFGRRVCVGRHIASATMWLTIVSILAAFKIEKARDKFGNFIDINDEYEDFGLVTHKKPFKCSITARSSSGHQLVEQSDVDV